MPNLASRIVYGFNLGENGLAFLGLFVGATISYAGFCVYNAKYQIPMIRKYKGNLPPEKRLPPAFFGAFCLPICLFWFGATSTPSVHWVSHNSSSTVHINEIDWARV
jgi:DHA1 family multidrug resistance protein-like MFS transporter